jgi:hypothetical protein
MNGVIIDDFESAIKKNKAQIEEINKEIKKINTEFNDINKNLSGKSLDFLTAKLYTELTQFKNLKLKLNGYQTTLKNVLLSYKNQSDALVESLNKIKQ